MRTTSMHFVNSLRSYLSSKVESRLLGMNERNYSLGDTFAVALQCELKAIASERRHNKRSTITVNNVNTEDQGHSQLEDTQEIHIRNPNYKGKNYDPNYHANCFLLVFAVSGPFTSFLVLHTVSWFSRSEVCAFVWGIFVRGLCVETFVRVLRSSRVVL